MKNYCLLLVMLVFLSLRLFAQEATEEAAQGWPIVERCVGEPTSPPADWSFEGTILATGWAGIHGINRAYDMPFVATFSDFPSYMPISISPDGHWIAEVVAGTEIDDSYWNGRRITIRSTIVYSTTNPHERYYSDYLSGHYTVGSLHVMPSRRKLKWWDEDSLVLGIGQSDGSDHLVVWSFLEDELSNLDGIEPNIDISNMYSFVSPDWTRLLRLNDISSIGLYLLDLETGENLQSFSREEIGALGSAQWFADSTGFVLRHESSEQSLPVMGMYNRDGELIDTLYIETDFAIVDNYELAANSQELALAYGAYAPDGSFGSSSIQIANLANREIIDTCISASSFKWSQNSRQLAIMPAGTGQRPVLIFDLEAWQLYNTGVYHSGNILFWRAD
jgi:hypothetical protein